jgi:ribonuclease R
LSVQKGADPLVDPKAVLDYLRERARHPLTGGELARRLKVPEDRHAEFDALLEEMAGDGRVYRQRKGGYALPEHLNLAIGRLQVTAGGDGFVLTDPDRPDVFIPQRHRGSAVDGDLVVARVEREQKRRNPEGRVIRVLRRAYEQVVGVYHRKRRGYGIVVPQEPPLSVDFFVPGERKGEAVDGDVVLARVSDWGDGEASPVAEIVEVLGKPDAPGVDVLAILLGHQLPLEFPEEVERAADVLAKSGVTAADMAGRLDMRDQLTLTIDPADARDHDDALTVRPMGDGRFELGVHIADVAHYVEEGSPLDVEALDRGTSVYLVDRVVPMLPHPLSSDLCSLVPGQDRLAMSVLFTVTGDGLIEGTNMVRTVIRSGHRLSYEDAQAILDGGDAPKDLAQALHTLKRLSRVYRRERRDRGSIDFDLPESRVVLNASGEPTDVQRVLRLEAHRLVEDLMILANEAVARFAGEQKLPLLYRIHERPNPERLAGLRQLGGTFGYTIPDRRLKPLDIAKLVAAMKGKPQEQLVTTVALRSMKQAAYSAENRGHFGLASEAYLHFTSPIRRYPDLVVHRQLGRWLDNPKSARKMDRRKLEDMAEHTSDRERRAERAERDSVDLKKIEFMERHLGEDFSGTISGVTAFGLFVLLDDFHVDGLVHVSTLQNDYYSFIEEEHALVGRRKRARYRLGDTLQVRVVRVDRERRRIDFELA